MPRSSDALAVYATVGGVAVPVLRTMVNGVQVWPVAVSAGVYDELHVAVDETYGGGPPMLNKVEFFATAGGAALTGTPVASSEAGVLTVAANAFDGDASTYWEGALGFVPATVGLQLATPSPVTGFAITYPTIETFYTASSPRTIRLVGVRGTTETTLYTVVSEPMWAPGTRRAWDLP